MRRFILYTACALLVLLLFFLRKPTDGAQASLQETTGDLFFDFTQKQSPSYWKGCNFSIENGPECAPDGRLLANGTLTLYPKRGSKVLTIQSPVSYTDNRNDIYGEIRLKAEGFDGTQDGAISVHPCRADGSIYGEDVCLTAKLSPTDLTANDYVTIRFTNATEFSRWQSLDGIEGIAIDFTYDDLSADNRLHYDYIYIGSERQNHVMMDFTENSPVNAAEHWSVSTAKGSIDGLAVGDGYFYGTSFLSDPAKGYTYLTIEDSLLYTVQKGDVVRLRIRLGRNAPQTGTLYDMRLGMGIGGSGYWEGYCGTILKIPAEDLKIDGMYHEYTVKIPDHSSIIGKSLRSLSWGFTGRGGCTLDFEIDYIYIGSQINFSAYTGRSTTEETAMPAEDDLDTVDNSLISFRLFSYGRRINDNMPYGLSDNVTLGRIFPFYRGDSDTDGNARLMPYLTQSGYPILESDNADPISLGCLFGDAGALGVHSYSPINTPLSFDGKTYSYDSTKHGVVYDTDADLFYVRNTADDGFTPFGYGTETGNHFGLSVEMSFQQMQEDAVLNLSCTNEAWVFIDGVLVLNLSGSAVKIGRIEFGSGEILVASRGKQENYTLLQCYEAAGREAATAWTGDTFAESSTHKLQIFFMERSAKKTQCKLSFDLSPIVSTGRHAFQPAKAIPSSNSLKKYGENTVKLWDKQEFVSVHNAFRLNYHLQVNGQYYQMGDTALYDKGASLLAILELYDPQGSEIGMVELMGSNGEAVYRCTVADSYSYIEIPLTATRSYYYLKAGSGNKQITTAPIYLEICNKHSPAVTKGIAPTCTTDGRTEGLRCSLCYAILKPQSTLPATGHRNIYTDNGSDHILACERCDMRTQETHKFSNAICICGAQELTAPILDENIRIRHTLDLESGIILNYAVAESQLKDYDSFFIRCILPEFEGNTQIGTRIVEILPVLKGKYYYFPLEELSAIHINDTIQAVVRMEKDGITHCSPIDRYSVADYAYTMLNSAGTDDALKSLCANLLAYGAEAQRFKAYRTDAPADARMTAAHRAFLSNTSELQFRETDKLLGDVNSPSVSWVGKALSLDSKVGIKLVFHAEGYPAEDLSVRLRYQDVTGTECSILLSDVKVYNASASYYTVTCYALAAAELRTVITATVFHGETQLSESLRYSAESYAAKAHGTALESLCKALFAYTDSAYLYFKK